jgi:hypothetical protein
MSWSKKEIPTSQFCNVVNCRVSLDADFATLNSAFQFKIIDFSHTKTTTLKDR